MLRTVNIGIIGCGRVTETFHLPALRSLPGARVAALSDTDSRRLDRVCGLYNIKARYPDPYELISREDIEAVAVCAPTVSHYALGTAVLDAGKHLFMEKPPALSMEESAGLAIKASRTPLKSLAGFNLRWHRNVVKAKDIIGSGALGTVKFVRTVMSVNDPELAEWRKKRALGGGSLLDLGIHHFDLLRHLFGAEVEAVHAEAASGEIDDETAIVSMKLSNGIQSSSVFSYGSGHANEIEVYGSKGIMKVSLYDIAGLGIRSSGFPHGGLVAGVRRVFDRIAQTAENAAVLKRGGIFRESYYREWESFLDSVINDNDAGCSLEDGSRALEIALAAIESASSGTPIKLSGANGEA